MPEWRKDPVVQRWVIIATERSKRPTDYLGAPDACQGCECPLCEGHEEETPPEIVAFREKESKADRPGWWVRVVPNKFPAVRIEGGTVQRRQGIYDVMDGFGAHEVIVETTEHARLLHEVSPYQMAEIIWAWRYRMLDLRRDRRFKYILLFKNFGAVGGASLEHSHSQIIATPMVPLDVHEEIQGTREYRERTGNCVFCDVIRQELAEDARVVHQNESFISFAPYASRFPFETWIIPREHQADFAAMGEDEVHSLARILLDTLGGLMYTLRTPPYNLVLHTTPVNGTEHDYHWHIEILPRLTRMAGFELGTGYFINPTPPEVAAQELRMARTSGYLRPPREEVPQYV
ncbi:MAG: galactose-1-phosphate uridylyltransferase [Peptococcaceae bacterium]|jgi:UDPglucose--hexose-1-phosphate uridylyltransferase|nr:galactose-1-phosphate uridylyltransferase [Peptococcaceae bacterium]